MDSQFVVHNFTSLAASLQIKITNNLNLLPQIPNKIIQKNFWCDTHNCIIPTRNFQSKEDMIYDLVNWNLYQWIPSHSLLYIIYLILKDQFQKKICLESDKCGFQIYCEIYQIHLVSHGYLIYGKCLPSYIILTFFVQCWKITQFPVNVIHTSYILKTTICTHHGFDLPNQR